MSGVRNIFNTKTIGAKNKTNKDYVILSQLAEDTKECFFGIKGKCSMSRILMIPEQIPFDYMHLVLQGHTKWLLSEYFQNKDSEADLSIIKLKI